MQTDLESMGAQDINKQKMQQKIRKHNYKIKNTSANIKRIKLK